MLTPQYEIAEDIPEFPNYEVTNYGRVFNKASGREMHLSRNQTGALTVGMVYDGVQYRRSVRSLVARAFVEGESELNNTPIQLDGNRDNLTASNIVWRPRWFAWEYMHQFRETPEYAFYGPVLDVVHGIEYESIFDACISNGYLVKHMYMALMNEGRVYPTGDTFIFLDSERR